MINNNQLIAVIEELNTAKRVMLFPHIFMDGDCFGSSVAMCELIREMGKEVYIYAEDKIPFNLGFLKDAYYTTDGEIFPEIDLAISIDCSDLTRLGKRKEKFYSANRTVCIDHHLTNEMFADVNCIDIHAAATGEIIFGIFHLLRQTVPMNIPAAEALYTAINTDTGNFQYTNTTGRTHYIISKLFEVGIDLEKITVELYQNYRYERIAMKTEVMNTLEIFCNGQANLAYATKDMYEKTGASKDETEGVIEELRNIRGIEMSAFLKENEENEIKVSFRAKTYGDVARVSQVFGGGGHKKASGCTIRASLAEAIELVKEAICAEMEL